ncbi:protein lin-28 homolog A-like [Drosophila eugracilis]|uniref:protein lin-28 homolog A-like n=2 Tax=Drosophila eugracilis TaxID=29029 RepID=UPI001BDB41AA|nr:protein lin-28 homolog A-like [Drosophila eugracilis]
MQKIDDKENLLRTLADVELKMPASRNSEAAPNNAMKEKRDDYKKGERCYNCNSVGHYAADCNKPKRKPGSCYACGSESHTINDCPMNKKKKTPTQNDYNV